MSEVTTFCSLWKLEFSARVSLFLTDHDDVIVYDEESYHPQYTAEGTLTESRTGLSVDSGGVRTSLTLPNVSAQDIRDGVLDGAQLSQFRHDWRSGETELLSKGRIGEVSFSGDEISVEWLGQASLLDASTGRVFSRQCDASFGDTRCGLNASGFADGTVCPRTFNACRDQFSNSVNFRGFPYLLGDDVLQAGVRESDRLVTDSDGPMSNTETRAAVLACAESWLHTPYRHQSSVKHVGTDCLGLIRGIWRELYGAEPEASPAYTPDWAEITEQETLRDAATRWLMPVTCPQPGDALLFRMAPNAPCKHIGILSTPNLILHAYWGKSVVQSHFAPFWQRRHVASFAFPSL